MTGFFGNKNNGSNDKELKKLLTQLTELHAQQAERDKQRNKRESQQSKWQVIQLAVALATIAGVLIAFYFGYTNLKGQQTALSQGYTNLRQQQQAAAAQDKGSRYSSISQVELDVDMAIADHPRLISCFEHRRCKANPPLNPRERSQATALATYIVDFYQYLYTQLEDLHYAPPGGLFVLRSKATSGKVSEDWVTWSETIAGGFRSSGMLCASLESDQSAYEWRFVNAVWTTHLCKKLKNPGSSPYE